MLCDAGNPELVPCDPLVGWDGEADGRVVQERRDMCILRLIHADV